MSYLHLITGLDRGGAETMLCKLAEAQPIPSSFATLLPQGGLRRDLGRHWEDLGAFLEGGLSGKNLCRIVAQMLQSPPEAIMTWMYHSDLMGAPLGWVLRRPVAWNLRGALDTTTVFKERTRLIIKILGMLTQLTETFVCSNSTRAIAAHRAAGYRISRWAYLPNGFDLHRFRPDKDIRTRWRHAHGIATDTAVLGIVARFDPAKNYNRFLRIAARLMTRRSDLIFVAMGRDVTRENAWFADRIAALGLSGRILLLGEIARTEEVIPALDLLCLTSDTEGFPNVLGEAMACGVPCVTTDVGDCREVVGDCGRVVAPQDETRFVSDCLDLLNEPSDIRESRRERCRARINNRFDLQKIATLYMKLCESLHRYHIGNTI